MTQSKSFKAAMKAEGIEQPIRGRKLLIDGSQKKFLVADDRHSAVTGEAAKDLCDILARHERPVNGVIAILPASGKTPDAEYMMRLFNPEGREEEMCGNALRCCAHYLAFNGFVKPTGKVNVETKAGLLTPDVLYQEGGQATIKMGMGHTSFTKTSTIIGPINIALPGQDSYTGFLE